MVVRVKTTRTDHDSPVSGLRFFLSIKYTNMFMSLSGVPAVSITLPDAFAHWYIIAIHNPVSRSKIFPFIVSPVAIYVVNFFWNCSGHPQKSQAMSIPMLAFDTYSPISMPTVKASFFPWHFFTARFNFPKKYARLRIVIENLFEHFLIHAPILTISPSGRNLLRNFY